MKTIITILFIAGMCSAQYGECFFTNELKNPFNRPMRLVDFSSQGILLCNKK